MKRYHLNINIFFEICVFIFVFLFSVVVLKYYVGGDQYYYRNFYEKINNVPIKDIQNLMTSYLGAREPLSGFILWLGSNFGIDKDIYISFLNAVLGLGLFQLCQKYKASLTFILLLMTNYYLIVLFTGAERLKIAFIFLVYGVLIDGKFGRYIFITSIIVHFQSIIIIISVVFNRSVLFVLNLLSTFRLPQKNVLTNIFLFVLFSISFVLLSDPIIEKGLGYSNHSSGIFELFQITILIFLSVFVFGINLNFLLCCIPLIISSYFMGSSRINILAVFVFLFFVLIKNKTKNVFVLLLMLYFSYGSIGFVSNVFKHGTGFVF